MTVAFQSMFGILERWNNNQVTPSPSKPHELNYRSNRFKKSEEMTAQTAVWGRKATVTQTRTDRERQLYLRCKKINYPLCVQIFCKI